MKAQMDLLKKKLERQEIVKEQHLRKAIKGKLNEINGIAVRMMVAGVFALVYNVLMLNHFGYSLYLQAGTFAMIAFSVIATYVQHRKLLEAREAALKGVDAMKATGFNESGDHEADGGDGTNQTLRLQALGQMGNINRTIQQIEEALHRIEDGSYGVCTVCGQLIRKPRLLNQPFVLTCMECQSEMERKRG
jgi:DnaK suppressor protein